MTDTCNSEYKANQLIADFVNGVFHSMFCHNHLSNVWVKNVIDYMTEFLRSHINNSLDEVAPELRVSPGFMYLACDFENMFSLCENYYKGLGEVFPRWMMDNNSGELLFHVEISVSGGRKDVTSMDAMEIFWNRNHCVEFLDDIISYCGIVKKSLHTI